jgi:hypothetical protein
MIGGSGGGGAGSGGSGGGGAGIGGSGGGGAGGCALTLQAPPPTGTHVDCPLAFDCSATYEDQIAKVSSDGGACVGPAAITVSEVTCGAHRILRRATFYWYEECLYASSGALVGSVNCGDTGCNYAGEVVDETLCLDAGLGPNLCPSDAGTVDARGPDAGDAGSDGGDAAQPCTGSAGFSCVGSCQTDVTPFASPICSNGIWVCPARFIDLRTCPCGSNLPQPPDSGCVYP